MPLQPLEPRRQTFDLDRPGNSTCRRLEPAGRAGSRLRADVAAVLSIVNVVVAASRIAVVLAATSLGGCARPHPTTAHLGLIWPGVGEQAELVSDRTFAIDGWTQRQFDRLRVTVLTADRARVTSARFEVLCSEITSAEVAGPSTTVSFLRGAYVVTAQGDHLAVAPSLAVASDSAQLPRITTYAAPLMRARGPGRDVQLGASLSLPRDEQQALGLPGDGTAELELVAVGARALTFRVHGRQLLTDPAVKAGDARFRARLDVDPRGRGYDATIEVEYLDARGPRGALHGHASWRTLTVDRARPAPVPAAPTACTPPAPDGARAERR
jgi:hypothetical protein